MTDRYSAFVVTLDHDIRSDDAEEGILIALRMIRGVIDVRPVTASIEDDIARGRVAHVFQERLLTLLKDLRT